MAVQAWLDPVLDVLDTGLRIYRRGFIGFSLIAALFLVPIAVGTGLLIAAGPYLSDVVRILLVLAWIAVCYVLIVYLVAALSRATIAAEQGLGIVLGNALRIDPLRLAGLSVYSFVFLIVTNIIASILSCLCICPMYYAMVFSMVGVVAGNDVGSVLSGFVFGLFGLVMLLFYGASIVISGASYSSTVYAMQAFIDADYPLGKALQRSIDLTFHKLGANLRMFLATSAIFGALAVAVSVAVGVLLPLPLFYALGEESLVAQGVSVSAWMLGLIAVIPPLPIWMTLVYRRNVARYEGTDLAERVATALGSVAAPEPYYL